MDLVVRRAAVEDIDSILVLLAEVHEIHVKLRPDLFISGKTKYTKAELEDIIKDDNSPVFAAFDDENRLCGYAFCVVRDRAFATNMHELTTLYIDDICVDARCRGMHVGTVIFNAVREFAKKQGYYNLTLNVWEGNDSARAFYENMGMFVRETQMELIL